MNISIVAVGKLKERYLRDGAEEYIKRLSAYTRLSVLEAADIRLDEGASAKERLAVLEAEAKGIKRLLPPSVSVFALDIEGETLSSEQFAELFRLTLLRGEGDISFVIGGSVGLSPQILSSAKKRISFGRMTFPHQLMRLILLEQIYRAFRINSGAPYHK